MHGIFKDYNIPTLIKPSHTGDKAHFHPIVFNALAIGLYKII